ncbi:S1C family serine protease [Calditrichota bacterium]
MKNHSSVMTIVVTGMLAILGTGVLATSAHAGDEKSDSKSGFLGIYPRELDDAMREALDFEEAGVLVENVTKDGPSDIAGVKAGDIILSVRDIKMFNVNRLHKVARRSNPGEKVDIVVLRDGKKKTIPVVVGEYEEKEYIFSQDKMSPMHGLHDNAMKKKIKKLKTKIKTDYKPNVWIGVMLDELSEQLGQYFGVEDGEGVLVKEVLENSPAEKAGLKAGDVIIKVENEIVSEASDIHKLLKEKNAGDEVEIGLIRDKKKMNQKIILEEPPEDFKFGLGKIGEDVNLMVQDMLEDLHLDEFEFEFEHDDDTDFDHDNDGTLLMDEDNNIMILDKNHGSQADGASGRKMAD